MTTIEPLSNASENLEIVRDSSRDQRRAGVTGLLLGWTSLGCGFAAVTSCQALLRWLLP